MASVQRLDSSGKGYKKLVEAFMNESFQRASGKDRKENYKNQEISL